MISESNSIFSYYSLTDDELRFGDEIEVGIVKIDKIAKTVKISVKSAELREVSLH